MQCSCYFLSFLASLRNFLLLFAQDKISFFAGQTKIKNIWMCEFSLPPLPFPYMRKREFNALSHRKRLLCQHRSNHKFLTSISVAVSNVVRFKIAMFWIPHSRTQKINASPVYFKENTFPIILVGIFQNVFVSIFIIVAVAYLAGHNVLQQSKFHWIAFPEIA